ncbi:MAG: CDP-alcohol phosphatidyltransferase family protein [Dorea sp.]|nr:CDP-alcohol phosphatidyltransferase family protein [Dorea sp.]
MLGCYDYTVIVTYLGLVSGVFGIINAATLGDTKTAVLCLMFSGICDMFDGKIARTKKNRTEEEKDFGIQIDSMCDLICFGVLPAAIGLSLGIRSMIGYLFITLYILAALIRLSYFNVLEKIRQTETDDVRKYYRGMPVTMSAIIIPIVFLMQQRLTNHFTLIYETTLLLVALLFVLDFKVKKADKKMMILLTVFGLLVALRYLVKGI